MKLLKYLSTALTFYSHCIASSQYAKSSAFLSSSHNILLSLYLIGSWNLLLIKGKCCIGSGGSCGFLVAYSWVNIFSLIILALSLWMFIFSSLLFYFPSALSWLSLCSPSYYKNLKTEQMSHFPFTCSSNLLILSNPFPQYTHLS